MSDNNRMKCVLSDIDIKEEIQNGNIIYRNVKGNKITIGNCSVDISLGENYFQSNKNQKILDPWDPISVRNFWGEPIRASLINKPNYSPETRAIIISPGQSILAHSEEFIGGQNFITTMMKSRSSMGRCNITVCRDAGWGDIGYINRWTLEITNNNTDCDVILPCGAKIAQLVFMYTGNTEKSYSGSYQRINNIDQLVESWTPDSMLPKLSM